MGGGRGVDGLASPDDGGEEELPPRPPPPPLRPPQPPLRLRRRDGPHADGYGKTSGAVAGRLMAPAHEQTSKGLKRQRLSAASLRPPRWEARKFRHAFSIVSRDLTTILYE